MGEKNSKERYHSLVKGFLCFFMLIEVTRMVRGEEEYLYTLLSSSSSSSSIDSISQM